MDTSRFATLIAEELWMYFEYIVGVIPGRLGKLLRMASYGVVVKMPFDVQLEQYVIIRGVKNLKVGSRTLLARGVWINARGGVTIGDNVLVGPGVRIISNGHRMDSIKMPMIEQGLYSKPISIGDDVWIGADSIILPGVTIGDSSVIAGGSVVTKDVAPLTIVAGNPAVIIRRRGVVARTRD